MKTAERYSETFWLKSAVWKVPDDMFGRSFDLNEIAYRSRIA